MIRTLCICISLTIATSSLGQPQSLSSGIYGSLGLSYYGTNQSEGLVEISPGTGYGAEAGLNFDLNDQWQLSPLAGLNYAAQHQWLWYDDTTLTSYFLYNRFYIGIEIKYLIPLKHEYLKSILLSAGPQLNMPGKLRFKGISDFYPPYSCPASLGAVVGIETRLKTEFAFMISPFLRLRYTQLSLPGQRGSRNQPDFLQRSRLDASGLELGLAVVLSMDEIRESHKGRD